MPVPVGREEMAIPDGGGELGKCVILVNAWLCMCINSIKMRLKHCTYGIIIVNLNYILGGFNYKLLADCCGLY